MEAEGIGASGFRDIRTPSGGSILTSFLPRPGVSWNAAAERQVLGSTQHPGHSLFLAKAVWALEQCSPSACAESLVGGAPTTTSNQNACAMSIGLYGKENKKLCVRAVSFELYGTHYERHHHAPKYREGPLHLLFPGPG